MAEIVVKLVNGELAGKSAQDLAKAVGQANKEINKAAIGTEEWVKANDKLERAKKLQGDYKKQLDSTTKASDSLKKSFGGVLSQIPGFSQLSGLMGQMKGGVGGLTSGFGMLRGAIAATGVGALLLVVMALISAFSSFTPLLDKIEVIMGGISAVVSELIQRFQQLGSGLWDMITGVPGGLDKVSSSFDGLADSMKKAYDAGAALAVLQQDLDDAKRGILITNAKESAQIDHLILQQKTLGDRLTDRLKILQDAKVIAEKNFKANDDLDKRELDALLQKAQLESRLTKDEILALAEGTLAQETEYAKRGKISDELLQKIVDAQVKVIEGEGRNNMLLEKILLQESKIREKMEADREKARRDAEKKAEDARKAEEKRLKEAEDAQKAYQDAVRNLEDLRIDAMEEGRTKDLAALQLHLSRELEEIQASGLLVAERSAAAREVARKSEAEVNSKWDSKDLKDKQDALKKQLEAIDAAYAEENLKLLVALADRDISRNEFDAMSLEAQRSAFAEKLALLEEQGQQETDLYRQIKAQQAQLEIDFQNKNKEGMQKAFQASIALGNSLIQSKMADNNREVSMLEKRLAGMEALNQQESTGYKALQKQLLDEKKKAGEKNKKLQKTQIKINMLAEVSQIWLNSSQLGWVGIILGALQTAAALVRGQQAMKDIDSQQFADGGAVGLAKGPSHKRGGIKGVVGRGRRPIEFEGGEFIFSKDATDALGPDNLAALNNRYTYATGGPVSPFTDQSRGPVSRSGASSADQSGEMNGQILDRLEAIHGAVVAWPQTLRVVNMVRDTKEGIETLNMIENDSDV